MTLDFSISFKGFNIKLNVNIIMYKEKPFMFIWY